MAEIKREKYLERLIAHKGNGRFHFCYWHL